MRNDFTGKAVLVTGGTMGIGLATGLAFGRNGAHAYLTHAWGSADENDVRRAFRDAGAPEPAIVQADAANDDDTVPLLERIKADHGALEVFVSNVSMVPATTGIESLSRRALFKSLEYCTWPLVSYLQQAKKILGRLPRYAVAISTDGVDHYYEGYDYVGLSKSVLETLVRYLCAHLEGEDIRINAIRTRNVITRSALAIHGEDYPEFVRKYGGEPHFIRTEEIGDAILALCSGLLDSFSGQVLSVDRGGPFSDSLMRLYRHREEYGL